MPTVWFVGRVQLQEEGKVQVLAHEQSHNPLYAIQPFPSMNYKQRKQTVAF